MPSRDSATLPPQKSRVQHGRKPTENGGACRGCTPSVAGGREKVVQDYNQAEYRRGKCWPGVTLATAKMAGLEDIHKDVLGLKLIIATGEAQERSKRVTGSQQRNNQYG